MIHTQASAGNFPPPIQGIKTRNIPGKLIIKYKIITPPDYEVVGQDIYHYPRLPFDLMVNGGKATVELPSGKKSSLTIKPHTPSGKKFRMKFQGLPFLKIKQDFQMRRYSETISGDFYVVPHVFVPESLTEVQIQAMEDAAGTGLFRDETKDDN